MIVTDIRRIDDKRYCLYIDYEPFASVYSSDIRRLQLRVGEEVDEVSIKEFRKEYLFRRALNKAVNSIKFSDKCEYDIRKKLKDLYYDEEIIEHSVEKLKTYGYIDDYRYACGYVRKNMRKKGRRIIEYELDGKHIGRDIVERALNDTYEQDEAETILAIIRKKYSYTDLTDGRNKVMAYLYSKGFDHRKINESIRIIQEECREQNQKQNQKQNREQN